MNYLNDTCCIHTADIWWNTSYKATFTPKNGIIFSLIEEYLWHGQFPALITWSGVLQQGTSDAEAVGFDMPVVQSRPRSQRALTRHTVTQTTAKAPHIHGTSCPPLFSPRRDEGAVIKLQKSLWQPKSDVKEIFFWKNRRGTPLLIIIY
jgi:hypothetical protein